MKPHGLRGIPSGKHVSAPRSLAGLIVPIALLAATFAAGCRSVANNVAAPAAPGPVYFAQITDTHHGPGIHQWRFDRAVDGINAAPFPFRASSTPATSPTTTSTRRR